MNSICVFCGSSRGNRAVYTDDTVRFGRLLVESGLTLVYGGGDIGLMGVLADAVLEAGGKVIGVIPRALVEKELAHHKLTELHVVETMHERKALMAERADAFVALPGGVGTADELFEIITWAQLGIHRKPIGLLNIAGFFDSLLRWVEHTIDEGFLRAKHRHLLLVASEPERLLALLQTSRPVEPEGKWLEEKDL
jgi:uncharacterized protein (TIGR00730 family)